MGDSDNTTTLPLVTCSSARARTAIATTSSQPATIACIDFKKDQSADPAVAAWREWQAAHEETDRLNREQQRMERELAETVGFPNVKIHLSDGRTVTLHSFEELRDLVGVSSINVAVVAKAEAELAAYQGRWDASDRAIGYSAVIRAEIAAGARAETLLEALSETPAISLAGVAAKLDAILREGQPSKSDAEFPWPQIRSVLQDAVRIGEQTANLTALGRFEHSPSF